MGGPKKYYTSCRFVYLTKIVVGARLRSPKQLLDNNSTEAMSNEYNGPRRLASSFSFESNQKVVGDIVYGMGAHRRPKGSMQLGVIAITENASIGNDLWDKMSRPKDGGFL